jgi:hypothetical protein
MSRIRERLAQERGWGLVSTMLVLGILVSTALPLMSLVDGQQRQTTHERKSESSFNLAEAAFDAELFVLSGDWPATVRRAYPPSCDGAATSLKCPNADILARTYAGVDYSARGWTVRIRDDGAAADYYDPALVDSQPTWDANRNAKMWVRADARAHGTDRTVVALVRRQDVLEPFPRNALTAGWFATSNNGNKRIVDTQGDTAQAAPVAVRCTAPPGTEGCLGYPTNKNQVSPDTVYNGYVGDTAVSEDALDRFRTRARALDTYHESGCPSSPEGEMVFVEVGDCSYTGSGDINTDSSPGVLIVARGTVAFGGSLGYYGLVYAPNLQRSVGSVVTIHGAATVYGAVAVDWGGGVTVGSNGDNIRFDDTVFPLLKSFGAAALVQGTWREIPAS